ncbi:MAG: hypothetical protein WCG60_01730 [bacterium]
MKIKVIKNRRMYSFLLLSLFSLLSYRSAFASTFKEVVDKIYEKVFSPIISLIIALAVVYFLYAVSKFVRSDGKERESGKELLVWGIIGLFVMMSVWGIVGIVRSTLQL